MFEVLVYVYENYWTGDTCPELGHLERKLHAVGFETDEIDEALQWLGDLRSAAHCATVPARAGNAAPKAGDAHGLIDATPDSMRVFSEAEQSRLGAQCLGYLYFLENATVLPAHMREMIMDRAMAAPGDTVALDDFKIIILMVYWSLGQEPDALLLDELCEDPSGRLAH